MSQVDTSAGVSDVLVSFRGVQKSYDGENLIVKDLNLDIRKGEFLTLLGPSGSGKTTSLMMLAGFETPAQARDIARLATDDDLAAYPKAKLKRK